MKIYVNGYDFSKKIVNYDNNFKNTFIYTNECIYSNYKKELHQIDYNESKIEEHKIDDYSFLLDNTKITYKETIQHIPYDHLCCDETIQKLNIGDGIYFIKNSYFDQDNYYFETDTESICFNTIITFLSSN